MGLAIFWLALAGLFLGIVCAWLLGYPYFYLLSFGIPGWLLTCIFLAVIAFIAIAAGKKEKLVFVKVLAWFTFVCFLIVRIAA